MWKYSAEYYAGTEVTNWPFNVLRAHLKHSNPFKTSIPVYISIKYRSTFICTYIFYTYIYCYVAIAEHWRRLFWSKVNISENCVFITFGEYLYGIFLPNISTDYLYVWKYSPEYYVGTEVTNWPFNMLTAHLKCILYIYFILIYTVMLRLPNIGTGYFALKLILAKIAFSFFLSTFNFFQLSQKHRFWLISLDLTEGFVSNFGHKSL